MSGKHGVPCTCPDCGEDLIITCPNRCARAELGATADPDPISLVSKPIGREPRRKVVPAANICERCDREIPPPQNGRQKKYHDACRTPDELRVMALKTRWNEKRRNEKRRKKAA